MKKYAVYVLTAFSFTLFFGCMKPMTQRTVVSSAVVAVEEEKQREIALSRHVDLQRRLSEVSYPLLVSAAALCMDDHTAGLGANLINKYSFEGKFRDTAIRLYGLTESIIVFYVPPQSSGDRFGLKEGDILLRLEDYTVKQGDDSIKDLMEFMAKEIKPGQSITVEVLRNGEAIPLEIQMDTICNYDVVISDSDSVNAFADGSRVVITRGMMRFTEDDQELGLVVSHEIAHNAMAHIDAKKINVAGGLLLDIIIAVAAGVNTNGAFSKVAARAYSQEFEAEADYVGLYIMQRAGYPIIGSANFWRRMAAEHPSSIQTNHSATHPATAVRFVAIEQTLKEIESKRRQGLAMMPEMEETTSGAGSKDDSGETAFTAE